jgi:hypothetical protein
MAALPNQLSCERHSRLPPSATSGSDIALEKLESFEMSLNRTPIPYDEHERGWVSGLALVRYTVESYHGTVEVETVLGRGSVFT